MRTRVFGIVLAILVAGAVGAWPAGPADADTEAPSGEEATSPRDAESTEASTDPYADPPGFLIAPDWPEGHYARLETYAGRIVARLLPDQAPQSVAHFAAMAEGRLPFTDPVSGERRQLRYYDGIPIHYVRAGLLFETGDWTTTGQGTPWLFVPPTEGAGPVNFNQAGCLGMARVNRNVSAVQFFVTASANPRFNNVFPCFGQVVEGISVVDQISQVKAHGNGRPLEMPKLDAIRIFRVGDPPPLPAPRQIPQKRPVPELRVPIDRR